MEGLSVRFLRLFCKSISSCMVQLKDVLFFFLKDLFIYLFMRDTEREREREAEAQAEGEAGSRQGA